MALDNAQFIAELSIVDPPGTDPLSQGDDQIRTIKRATQQSFPNIDKAVTLTADQMNEVAIKNEANVFTATQELLNADLLINQVTDQVRQIIWQVGGIARWSLRMESSGANTQFNLRRSDAGGVEVDKPFTVDFTTGIVDFAQVPTVQGVPLWIAGELKMLVVGSTVPSSQWFVADGTSGTVDLRERFIGVEGGGFSAEVPAFLSAKTDAGGVSGSHVLTEAELAAHNHRARGGNATGITDVAVGATSNETVFGANRNNTAGVYVENNSNGNAYIQNSGSNQGHTHTLPEQNVEADNTGSQAVVPFSYFAIFIQYVP